MVNRIRLQNGLFVGIAGVVMSVSPCFDKEVRDNVHDAYSGVSMIMASQMSSSSAYYVRVPTCDWTGAAVHEYHVRGFPSSLEKFI